MKLIPALLAGAAFAASAHATDIETAENAWSLVDGSNNGAIYSTSAEEPTIIFTCDDKGRLTSLISIEGDALTKLRLNSNRSRKVDGMLAVGDQDSAEISWSYYPGRKIVSPVENRYARRIYNAVVTGNTVTVDLGRRGSFTVSSPDLNDDFKAFAGSCSAK